MALISLLSCIILMQGDSVTQAVRRSPPTAGVPNSRLAHSMRVSQWTKLSLGRFFLGLLFFSLARNFIPPFLHTNPHSFNFVSFHFIHPCDGTSGVVDRYFYSQTFNKKKGFLASHLSTRPCVRPELRIFIYLHYIVVSFGF